MFSLEGVDQLRSHAKRWYDSQQLRGGVVETKFGREKALDASFYCGFNQGVLLVTNSREAEEGKNGILAGKGKGETGWGVVGSDYFDILTGRRLVKD